jgi:hypothetical protein
MHGGNVLLLARGGISDGGRPVTAAGKGEGKEKNDQSTR